MLAHGYATQRGRRAALVHYDAVQPQAARARGSRMTAIISGGAIPEVFDYRVLLEPEGHFIGTLNEDFAIESLPGDIFQLGNTSWRILQIGNGVVRVADAQGQPPSMPFWLGEAPARSDEMSAAVSRLRAAVDASCPGPDEPRKAGRARRRRSRLLESDYRPVAPGRRADRRPISPRRKRALGVVPTADTLVLERFFDESGGMQLVLHAPFGSRINRAWGLALRKKFCQGFNFELQAAATEEGVMLSLGAAHSFPLEDVFRYLHPKTVRETLVQAVLDSPIFETRWRWSTTLALAVPRNRGGARVPTQLQRMNAEDLLRRCSPTRRPAWTTSRARARFPTIRSSTRRCAMPRGGDGPATVSNASCSGFSGRDRSRRARHARAVGAQPRAPEFRRLHVPRRRAARGAAHARRLHAARDRGAQRRRSRRARPGRDRARAPAKPGRSRTPPTRCTTR